VEYNSVATALAAVVVETLAVTPRSAVVPSQRGDTLGVGGVNTVTAMLVVVAANRVQVTPHQPLRGAPNC